MTKASRFVFFSAVLFAAITLANPVQAAAVNANSEAILTLATSLTEFQKDELEQIVDDRLERSAAVGDRIQSIVNENFGLLFAMSGLTISALRAIPVFSAAIIFIFRRSILEGIRSEIAEKLLDKEMQEILEDEVKKQLSSRVEENLSNKIKQRLTELEKQADGDLSAFKAQLDQLLAEVEKDKQEYLLKLASLDLNVVREAAAKAASDKLIELVKTRPLLPRLGRARS